MNKILTKKLYKIVKEIEKVEKSKIDELEKEILLSLLYLKYWRIKFVLENGLKEYLKRCFKNFRIILNQFRLNSWLSLVRKNKKEAAKYVAQIREFINKIEEAMIDLIPEEHIEWNQSLNIWYKKAI